MCCYTFEMVPKKSLGKQLTDAREAAGLSQEELGEAVGAAGRTVSTWETGVHRPTKRVQATIESLYGWPPGSISYAMRTGSDLPEVTASFAPGVPRQLEAAAVERARIAQSVADGLERLTDQVSALSEQVTSLEDRVGQLEGSRGQRAQGTKRAQRGR